MLLQAIKSSTKLGTTMVAWILKISKPPLGEEPWRNMDLLLADVAGPPAEANGDSIESPC